MIPAIIIIAIIVIILLILIGSYNKLVKQKVTVEEAFSTMDVYMKKRFDLIPNLVETVKGYAKHEEETLTKAVSLRNQNYSKMSPEEKIENSAVVSRMIPQIMALAESYPDLKANKNFMELSSQLEAVENDIASARRYYNGTVKQYNVTIQSVPTNIVAGMFHFETKPMFEVDREEERQNVQVKF